MVNYDGRHNMVGQNRQPQVRMVSHAQIGCLRCGKGPSSHVSSPVTGQCPKIELFLFWKNIPRCGLILLFCPWRIMPSENKSPSEMEIQENCPNGKSKPNNNSQKNKNEIKIQFDEIVAEPDQSLRSISHVWNVSVKIFQFTSQWCYWILSALLAVPFAILWAVVFAFSSFFNVWFTQPLIRTVGKFFLSIFQVYEKIVLCLFGPIGQAFGRCFQNVRLYTVKSQSQQPPSGNV
ncbi:Caveolin-1 [Trichinella murrelli]|uniref:Caveolin n=2 Tax=Trichinella TaxID=6333 RepID=A0A0V0TRJ7_9BILA|nr:Caveolin-1 [Trichinella murrelli]